MNNFENLLYALQSFYLLENLENYKNHAEYEYFCELIFKLHNQIIALDSIDKEDIND